MVSVPSNGMSRRSLLFVAIFLATVSLILSVSGGFATTLQGIRLSARSPIPSLAAAIAACLAWLALAWRARAVTRDLEHVDNWLSRRASMIALVIAGLAAAVTLQFSTFSASGSDASGYLSQADMLWRRQIMRAEPLASVAQWTNAAATLAPLGWNPARENGFQVPTYAPGLPLLMAPLHALGGAIAASLVTCRVVLHRGLRHSGTRAAPVGRAGCAHRGGMDCLESRRPDRGDAADERRACDGGVAGVLDPGHAVGTCGIRLRAAPGG